ESNNSKIDGICRLFFKNQRNFEEKVDLLQKGMASYRTYRIPPSIVADKYKKTASHPPVPGLRLS
ncbi:hypothetical protein, partial [Sporomusa sp.]|uniref:hypothetical protein n=1 Tax=Sporomusa sp. TaxID=2078658 RepID=UPI002BB64D23